MHAVICDHSGGHNITDDRTTPLYFDEVTCKFQLPSVSLKEAHKSKYPSWHAICPSRHREQETNQNGSILTSFCSPRSGAPNGLK